LRWLALACLDAEAFRSGQVAGKPLAVDARGNRAFRTIPTDIFRAWTMTESLAINLYLAET
jgi:hypothetical protein